MELPKVSTVQRSLASVFDLMDCHEISTNFLEKEPYEYTYQNSFQGLHDIFQEKLLAKNMEMRNPNRKRGKQPFVFHPDGNIKALVYKNVDGNFVGAVLIGHFLFDCSKKYPTYVDVNSEQMNNVKSYRVLGFLNGNNQMKENFMKLVSTHPVLSYGV